MIKKLLMTLALSLGLAANAAADAYPSRAIKVIVPFPAGQASDTIARLVGEQLGRALGQAVVVENRPGAGGNIGSEAGARSAPDGYTLTMATAALPISKNVYKKLPFDPARDFEPVSLMTVTPLVLIARPSLPANDVASLVDLARKQPGKLTFASSGQGTSHHLSGELLKAVAGVDILHVPYKGSAPAVTDLIGGQINVMFDNISNVLPHVKSGKLRALAVTTPARSPLAPEVPTVIEAGVPGYELGVWFGIAAPGGTPRPIVDKLNAEIVKILRMPDVKEKFAAQGVEAIGSTVEQFQAHLQAQRTMWAKVVKDAGVTPE